MVGTLLIYLHKPGGRVELPYSPMVGFGLYTVPGGRQELEGTQIDKLA